MKLVDSAAMQEIDRRAQLEYGIPAIVLMESAGALAWIELKRVVSRSGNMAHVWSSYASARTEGGEPYARGVNSITLFHDGERWWIMGWMFDSSAG